MKKKILSLALALVMCLGLTVPAFAETMTEEYDGITITAQYDGGSTASLTYTGSGELWDVDAGIGLAMLEKMGAVYDINLSVNIGQGLTVTEDWDFVWEAIISDAKQDGVSISFNYGGTQPTTPTQPEQPEAETIASPTNDKLEVNGAAADPTVYKINDSNYFKIRDVAALLNGTEKQFAVGYDGALKSVTATTGQGYDKLPGDLEGAATGGSQTAEISNDTIYVDGQKVEAEVYKINGSNYFKLRDLGKALNFYVGWTAERGMYIETDKPYSE